MTSNEYRKELSIIRVSLERKSIKSPIKTMIERYLWVRTKQDNNYYSGRTIDKGFLNAIKKLDNIIK